MTLIKKLSNARLAPTVAMISIVLLASWMASSNGGYFTTAWAPVALILGVLFFAASFFGLLGGARSRWSTAAIALFAAYVVWTLLSLLWSPNKGAAWEGAGLAILYLLVFWVTVIFVGLGASRRWIFAASVIGPAVVAALTLAKLVPHLGKLFEKGRLMGTVGYYNGEAAFLLIPFWAAIYLAGSRSVNPILRGAALAGSVLCLSVAVLSQSRGAMIAMAISIPVFFIFSGQRLRGFIALIPVVAAMFITFPELNAVYVAFLKDGNPASTLGGIIPAVWLSAAGAGLYGLLWGLVDRTLAPPVSVVRAVGGLVLAGGIVALGLGALAFHERVGNPVSWSEQKWEAFKFNDTAGQEQSRYLSASGHGRYTLWKVARKDFVSHPLLGVGTQNYEATYYRLRDRTAGNVLQPHSLPLEVLAEQGIVGGLLFFGFLSVCLAGGLWKRFGKLDPEEKAQLGVALAAVSYWFIHSSDEWFWQLPAITMPAIVYLATLVAPWEPVEFFPSRWPRRVAGVLIALSVIAIITPLYAAGRYLHMSETVKNPWMGLEYVERAQRLDPVDPQLPEREAILALKIGDTPRAEAAFRREAHLNPDLYAPYQLLGSLYQHEGKPGKARVLYRKALSLNPLDRDLRKRLDRLEQ